MNNTQKTFLIVLLFFAGLVFGQSTPPPPDPPTKGLPIDGLIWFCGIVALTYGAIKKHNNSKK